MSAEPPLVRALVEILALAGVGIWAFIWFHAPSIRPLRQGILLRGRAVVFVSFALSVAVMSILILLHVDSQIISLWRLVNRIHAVGLVVIIGVDIIINEYWGSRG